MPSVLVFPGSIGNFLFGMALLLSGRARVLLGVLLGFLPDASGPRVLGCTSGDSIFFVLPQALG